MLKIVDDGKEDKCEGIFDDLIITLDIQNQVSVLKSLQSGGFWGSIFSLLATFAFLIDEKSKIDSTITVTLNDVEVDIHDKIIEGEFGDAYLFDNKRGQWLWKVVDPKTMVNFYLVAFVVAVIQAVGAILLGMVT